MLVRGLNAQVRRQMRDLYLVNGRTRTPPRAEVRSCCNIPTSTFMESSSVSRSRVNFILNMAFSFGAAPPNVISVSVRTTFSGFHSIVLSQHNSRGSGILCPVQLRWVLYLSCWALVTTGDRYTYRKAQVLRTYYEITGRRHRWSIQLPSSTGVAHSTAPYSFHPPQFQPPRERNTSCAFEEQTFPFRRRGSSWGWSGRCWSCWRCSSWGRGSWSLSCWGWSSGGGSGSGSGGGGGGSGCLRSDDWRWRWSWNWVRFEVECPEEALLFRTSSRGTDFYVRSESMLHTIGIYGWVVRRRSELR